MATPGRPPTRRRHPGLLVVGVTLALAIGVLAGWWSQRPNPTADMTPTTTQSGSASVTPSPQSVSSTVGPSASQSRTPSASPTPMSRAQALTALQAAREGSLQSLTFNGRYTLTVSSKYEGVSDAYQVAANGTHTFYLPDIYADYLQAKKAMGRHSIPTFLLLATDIGGTHVRTDGKQVWMVIALAPNIGNLEQAKAACQRLFPQYSGEELKDHCLPRTLQAP